MIDLTEGLEFSRVEGDTNIRIYKINTHYIDGSRKKQKYSDPVIEMEYLESDKKNFKTPTTEVKRMIHMERWHLIKPTI